MPLGMGKVLSGGSSINVMGWARGHKNDWNFFASESGDRAWNYESVLNIYRRMEDWQGAPDPTRRGTGGLVSCSPRLTPIQSLRPWWTQRVPPGCQLPITTMDE
jgi:choline dehydrogenase